jgi:hypothetical protein
MIGTVLPIRHGRRLGLRRALDAAARGGGRPRRPARHDVLQERLPQAIAEAFGISWPRPAAETEIAST